MCWPRAFARLQPSAVRVLIRSRSTSASPPRTAINKRPVLVAVAAHGSASERNCAPASTICLTMHMSRRSRPIIAQEEGEPLAAVEDDEDEAADTREDVPEIDADVDGDVDPAIVRD
jgi:hypothetical protein